jgi:hypothetical protein
VHRSLRIFRALFGLALAALFLAGPATAWRIHEVAHAGSPVSATAHHHHDDSSDTDHLGEAAAEADSDGAPSSNTDRDGGHDHLPSLTAGLSAMIEEGPRLIAPLLVSITPERPIRSALSGHGSPPHIRPPRIA